MITEYTAVISLIGGLLGLISVVLAHMDRKLAAASVEETRNIKLKWASWSETTLWLAASAALHLSPESFASPVLALLAFLIHTYFYLSNRVKLHRQATAAYVIAALAVLFFLLATIISAIVSAQTSIVGAQESAVEAQGILSQNQERIIEQQSKIIENQLNIVSSQKTTALILNEMLKNGDATNEGNSK